MHGRQNVGNTVNERFGASAGTAEHARYVQALYNAKLQTQTRTQDTQYRTTDVELDAKTNAETDAQPDAQLQAEP